MAIDCPGTCKDWPGTCTHADWPLSGVLSKAKKKHNANQVTDCWAKTKSINTKGVKNKLARELIKISHLLKRGTSYSPKPG